MLFFRSLAALLSLTTAATALTWKGADISSIPVSEAAGTTFKDTNGVAGKAENILKAHGLNTARVRIWTAGTYNLAFGLALGKVRPSAVSFQGLSLTSSSSLPEDQSCRIDADCRSPLQRQ